MPVQPILVRPIKALMQLEQAEWGMYYVPSFVCWRPKFRIVLPNKGHSMQNFGILDKEMEIMCFGHVHTWKP